MIHLAEFYNTESEELRRRRVRMMIFDWQHLATIGKGGFGNVRIFNLNFSIFFQLEKYFYKISFFLMSFKF